MGVLRLALIAGAVTLLSLQGSPARAADACTNPVGRLVALQGAVDLQRGGLGVWRAAALEQALCAGDLIRVGERSRAAIVLLDDGVIRIDESTTLRLARVGRGVPSLIEMALGRLYFFSRRSRSLDVATPFVNAAVEGTEFLVDVGGDRTRVVVYEGRVLAANDRGQLPLRAGEAAEALAGEAPTSLLLVQPRNAVQWAVYYPPVLLAERGEAWPPSLRAAVAAAARGDAAKAFAELDRVPADRRGADFHSLKASLLLSAGRRDAAWREIEAAEAAGPGSARAQALRAIVAVVEDRPEEALAAGRRAAAQAPGSAAALIALSYAEQANLELERARDTLLAAVKADPNNAFAHARLAELWLELGYVDRASEAISKAERLAPDLERVQTIRGFVALARFRPKEAEQAFRKGVALDSASPLPRFGLGLTSIRRGHVARGRNDIEIATGLDPNRSLLRSYLGKAYFAERREPLAGEQYAIAKELDPRDPTPWFYDAILKQSENRPVEALRDLERSIELNDNRAVFRSRLLLDRDRASRQASIGRIYDDLGFEQLGINEASRSLSLDPGNASAHRFLADVYAPRPRTEIARVSEVLQAQLLQDITINPVPPSLAETRLAIPSGSLGRSGFNEFSSVFERNQVQLNLTGLVGNNQTYGNEAVVSAVHDGLSLSAGQFHYQTNGFRANNDLRHDIYNVFAQAALSPTLNVQAEVRSRRTESGDLDLNFDPSFFSRGLDRDLDQDTARLGARYSPAPHSDVIASLIYSDRKDKLTDEVENTDDRSKQSGFQGEAQWIFRQNAFNVQTGLLAYNIDGDTDFGSLFVDEFFEPRTRVQTDKEQFSAYSYLNINFPRNVTWTAGFSYDAYEDDGHDLDVLAPKLGIQWSITDALRVRAVTARTLKPALLANQTIQPTQVAGFNQFYDDTSGTRAWLYGVGIDAELRKGVYAGSDLTHRALDEIVSIREDSVQNEGAEETTARAYLYWTPTDQLAFNVEAFYDLFERDQSAFEIRQVKTYALPVGLRYFSPSGVFAGIGGSLLYQSVEKRSGSTTPQGDDVFYVVDAGIGYRFPRRRGLISLEVQNLLDHDFNYQDDNYRKVGNDPAFSPYLPDQTVIGRLTLSF